MQLGRKVDPALVAIMQRENEPDRAYIAMLLWGIQGDKSRNEIARCIGCDPKSVNYWQRKFDWKARVESVPNSGYLCIELFRERLNFEPEGERRHALKAAFEVVLGKAPASLRSYVRRESFGLDVMMELIEEGKRDALPSVLKPKEEVQQKSLADQVKEDYLSATDIKRQVRLIDATLGLIAKKVGDGSIKVSVRDIPALIKARALLTGLPTQSIHVYSKQEVSVKESPRIAAARKGGDDALVIDALAEDVGELSVIIHAVRNSNAEEAAKERSKVMEINPEGQVVDLEEDSE